MTSERWRNIERLFHAALERPADERTRFLFEACGNDLALHSEVESLLRQKVSGVLDHGVLRAAVEILPTDVPTTHEGHRLGRYVLGPLLGAGGMGEVYSAHDTKLGRDIAIKILAPRHHHDRDASAGSASTRTNLSDERLDRFEREARALASLNHPHIAGIYGYEEGDGLQGLLLELVDGQTLASRLQAGPIAQSQTLRYVSQLADAFQAAHAKGIVHRDLKPSNVQITSGDTVKVLDFGIAKIASDEDGVGRGVTANDHSLVLGTASYMSPEQARGALVDHRTDIWAFGCVLYEMLSGRRAFGGDTIPAVLSAVVDGTPYLDALPPRTSRALRSLITRCLAKDPDARPADMRQVKAVIDAAADARARFRRWLAAAASAVVVLALAGTVVMLVRGRAVSDERNRSRDVLSMSDAATLAALTPVRLTTSSGFDGFPAFAHDGQRVAYASDRSGRMEIYASGLLSASTPIQLTSNGRQKVQPAWSPDDQFIAFHEMAHGGIWIVPSRGGEAHQVAEFGSNPAWSPDGRLIAFASAPLTDVNAMASQDPGGTIWTIDVAARSKPVARTTIDKPGGSHVTPAWLSNSQRLLYAVYTGPRSNFEWWSIDIVSGQQQIVASHPKLTNDFAIAPGGRGVYFKARDAAAVWWLALSVSGQATGDPQPTGITAGPAAMLHLTVAPDGRRIGWTTTDQTMNVWAVALEPDGQTSRGETTALTNVSGARFGQPSAAADGRIAMVGSRPGANSSVFVLNDGEAPKELTTAPRSHGAPRWLTGDREIAFVTDQGDGPGMRAIDVTTARARLLFPFSALRLPSGGQPTLSGPALANALAADASRFAFAITRDGVPNIWVASLSRGTAEGTVVQRTFEKEFGGFPSWSPDGRWLAYQCSRGADVQLCLTSAESGEAVQLTNETGQSWTGGWSPDNDKVLIAARRDGVWNVAWVSRTTRRTEMLTRFTEPRMYVRYPRWDRANNRVLFEHSDTHGRLWMVERPEASQMNR